MPNSRNTAELKLHDHGPLFTGCSEERHNKLRDQLWMKAMPSVQPDFDLTPFVAMGVHREQCLCCGLEIRLGIANPMAVYKSVFRQYEAALKKDNTVVTNDLRNAVNSAWMKLTPDEQAKVTKQQGGS